MYASFNASPAANNPAGLALAKIGFEIYPARNAGTAAGSWMRGMPAPTNAGTTSFNASSFNLLCTII
jgi:hypothetical protein